MGCGASSATGDSGAGAAVDTRSDPKRSPVSAAIGRDRQVLRADTGEFSGWQGDTFSPAVAEVKAARRNPNDISAPRDAVPGDGEGP